MEAADASAPPKVHKIYHKILNQLFHWTFINFNISLAILDTSYLNMHFFGTHTCLCRLQNCPSADFGVFKYAWAVTQKVWNEAENGVWGSRVLLSRHALPTSLLILRKKPTVLQSTILDIYDTAWSDQIRSRQNLFEGNSLGSGSMVGNRRILK